MSVSVSLYTIFALLVGALAMICIVVRQTLRGRPALGWLSLVLVGGVLATLLYDRGGHGIATVSALSIIDVVAIGGACIAVRHALDLGLPSRRLLIAAAILTASSQLLFLLGIGWPFLASIPFQLASILVLTDAVRVSSRRLRGTAEWAMFAGLLLNLVTCIVRLPFWPSLLDSGRAFPSLASPWLNLVLLVSGSIFVPLVVLGVLGREIGLLVGNYRDRSERDGMTGLHHRLSFEARVAEASASCGVLIIADIDNFKAINDRYGHAVGDRVIRAFADLVAAARGIPARVGGEEFALAMPGATVPAAESEAEAIRRAFHAIQVSGMDPDHFLSASFGVADYRAGDPFNKVFARADAALYDAKARGRNKTVVRVDEDCIDTVSSGERHHQAEWQGRS